MSNVRSSYALVLLLSCVALNGMDQGGGQKSSGAPRFPVTTPSGSRNAHVPPLSSLPQRQEDEGQAELRYTPQVVRQQQQGGDNLVQHPSGYGVAYVPQMGGPRLDPPMPTARTARGDTSDWQAQVLAQVAAIQATLKNMEKRVVGTEVRQVTLETRQGDFERAYNSTFAGLQQDGADIRGRLDVLEHERGGQRSVSRRQREEEELRGRHRSSSKGGEKELRDAKHGHRSTSRGGRSGEELVARPSSRAGAEGEHKTHRHGAKSKSPSGRTKKN